MQLKKIIKKSFHPFQKKRRKKEPQPIQRLFKMNSVIMMIIKYSGQVALDKKKTHGDDAIK